MKRIILILVLLMFAFALIGCASAPPQVVITTPVSGAQFDAGQDIPIVTTAGDANGVTQIELFVDGQRVKTDPSPTGQPQKTFSVQQVWKATTPGAHIVIVRALTERGATGEAAISITIVEKIVIATPTPTLAPTRTPVANVTRLVVVTPRPATPTVASVARSITFTEAQMLALINTALAGSEFNSLSVSSVKFQNGQIIINGTYNVSGGLKVNGSVTLAVSASNCDLKVTIVAAQIGQFTIPAARKAEMSAAIDQAISSAVAQQTNARCIEAITIANGKMTITYR
ncbi:MAG: Ig-like domain-containing protein [Chloroflexi bacterium]|nr:Ig-like domain-containing protein [Chloroflexota bacterium]